MQVMSSPLMDGESISVSLDERKAKRDVFRSSVMADSILWLRYVDEQACL